jgi:hypothetical protein
LRDEEREVSSGVTNIISFMSMHLAYRREHNNKKLTRHGCDMSAIKTFLLIPLHAIEHISVHGFMFPYRFRVNVSITST